MRVLVAVGAGYIGPQTCSALAQAGHTPIVHPGSAWHGMTEHRMRAMISLTAR